MRRLAPLAAAVLLALVPAQSQSQAQAQTQGAAQDGPRNGTAFADWTVVCAAEAPEQNVCALAQTLENPETGALLAEIGLNPLGSGDAARLVMVLRTPTSMLLSVRPAFRVGAGPTVPLNWHTCTGDTCSALLTLDDASIRALRRGITMIVGYQPLGQDRPLTFPVSLRGVTAGLRALGVD